MIKISLNPYSFGVKELKIQSIKISDLEGRHKLITAKAPGKLFIAGEYAVVETSFPAILVALDKFVTCSVEPATGEIGRIYSEQYQNDYLSWRRLGDQVVVDKRDNPFSYILSAISVTEEYARALHRELRVFDLHIDSELDNRSGRKYGLGSSAAVTVATIQAFCEFYNLPADKNRLFKLAAIAHFEVQGNGSLGDVAASVYGGWIAYHSFDRQWLAQQRQYLDIMSLLSLPWPELKIEPLKAPKNLKLLIGWTGSPASTSRLVDKISIFKAKQQTEYHHFLAESKACIHRMINGFEKGDLNIIKREIRYNRTLLRKLADMSGVQIETPVLHKMVQIAEHFGGAAKSSGAGGGDCGIVAIDTQKDDLPAVLKRWSQSKIESLPMSVHFISDNAKQVKRVVKSTVQKITIPEQHIISNN